MKFMSFIGIFLIGSMAYAQTGVIGKVKGSRAIVDFKGVQVNPGDVITVQKGSSPSSNNTLRKREHSLTWLFNYSYVEAKSDSSTFDVEDIAISFGYGYNFESFELGGLIGRESTETNLTEAKSLELGVYGQFNFIANNPDHDLIPYIRGEIRHTSLEDGTSSDSVKTKGMGWSGKLGLLWFPFSEIFSVDVGYRFGESDIETSETPKRKSKVKERGPYIGWRIYF